MSMHMYVNLLLHFSARLFSPSSIPSEPVWKRRAGKPTRRQDDPVVHLPSFLQQENNCLLLESRTTICSKKKEKKRKQRDAGGRTERREEGGLNWFLAFQNFTPEGETLEKNNKKRYNSRGENVRKKKPALRSDCLSRSLFFAKSGGKKRSKRTKAARARQQRHRAQLRPGTANIP